MARLFLPGPTDVAPEVLAAQAQPMIGHRSRTCTDMIGRIQPLLRQVLQTRQRVFISTSSGTGLQEAAVRNCVADRLLVAACGAFGERWHEVAVANGIPADRVDADWGQPNTPEQVSAALARRHYDALAVVHNESSTGVESPVAEIVRAARARQPDLLVLVDAVSSAAGVDIRTDEWGLDVLLTSSQKCFGLPPGLAFAAVSDRALDKASGVPHRGWYFDFVLFEKYQRQDSTPATPAVSLLFALEAQLDRILAEGLPRRFERHARMASLVQAWAQDRFALFAAEGYRSQTVTAIRNTRSLDIAALNAHLARWDMSLADGYGRLKGQTFRIGHMGEIHPEDVAELTARIDEFLQIHR